jgi:AAA ATPase domain
MASDDLKTGRIFPSNVLATPFETFETSTEALHEKCLTRLRLPWPLSGRDSELKAIQALLDEPRNRTVYLFGAAGVGKTRLSSELRAHAVAAGKATFRIVGNATTKNVPFGSVAHLLQDQLASSGSNGAGPVAKDAENEAALLIGMVERTVREAGGGRSILFVDDAQLLDSLSATVVALIIAHGRASVVATVRLGEDLPDALSSALRSGEAARFDIEKLNDLMMDDLLASVRRALLKESRYRRFVPERLGMCCFCESLLLALWIRGR